MPESINLFMKTLIVAILLLSSQSYANESRSESSASDRLELRNEIKREVIKEQAILLDPCSLNIEGKKTKC